MHLPYIMLDNTGHRRLTGVLYFDTELGLGLGLGLASITPALYSVYAMSGQVAFEVDYAMNLRTWMQLASSMHFPLPRIPLNSHVPRGQPPHSYHIARY